MSNELETTILTATQETDLDDALAMVQEALGVDSGDFAGVYFSGMDGIWERSDIHERVRLLGQYAEAEARAHD